MCVYWIRSSVPGVVTWGARRNVAPRVAAAFGHQHFVSCPSTHQLVWHLMRAYISPVQAHPMCTASLYRVLHLHICSCSQWRIWHFSIYCIPYTVYCGYFPISHITIWQFQIFLASLVIFCRIFWFCQIETNACVSSCRYEVDIHACYFYDKFEWLLSAVLKYLTNEISNCNERLIFTFMASAAGLHAVAVVWRGEVTEPSVKPVQWLCSN